MENKKIKKIYNSKIKLLQIYNENYFIKNKSLVPDSDYDKLKKEILDLENSYGFLESKFSPAVYVGFKPSKNFKKVTHKVPMLSLGNAFSEEDLENFQKKNTKFSI